MNNTKIISLILLVVVSILSTGCASVPMEPQELSNKAKRFDLPPKGSAGLYVYRDTTFFGAGLKKDVYVDNKCLGETGAKVFFYTVVEGNREHSLATESEFSPNVTTLITESGKNYFIKQYIKPGVFIGGANLELVSEEEGKKDILGLEMAKNGTCDK